MANVDAIHRHRTEYKIICYRAYFADSRVDSLRRRTLPDYRDDSWKEYERQVWDIEKLRTRALGNPFHPGLILPPVIYIEPVVAPTNGRPLPRFALNGGSFKLRMERAIVPYEGEPQYWHMWLAKVILPDGDSDSDDCGNVMVKVFQQSLMGSPLRCMFTPSATQLACSEDWVYSHMTQIQGIHVQYCFGLYKIDMAHGESIFILLLEWVDALHKPHNLIDEEAVLESCSPPVWDEKKKEDVKHIILSVVCAFRAMNFECGVFLHENGEQNHHILLREPENPPQVIIVNFSECMAEVEGDVREEFHSDDVLGLLGHIGIGRYFKDMGLKEWAYERGINAGWMMHD